MESGYKDHLQKFGMACDYRANKQVLRLNLRCCPAEKIKVLRFLQGIDNQIGSTKNTRMKLTLKISGGYIFAVLIGCPEAHI